MGGGDRSGALADLLEEGRALGLFSGAAAGVSAPAGRIVAEVGTLASNESDPVDARSLFDLASVTKTFLAAAVVRLAGQGRLDLDASVAGILPVGAGGGADAITLRMLLTHVAGLPAQSLLWRDPAIPPDERVAKVLAAPLESAPDAVHRYSCVGYVAAGAVVERVTGSALSAVLGELVMRPLRLSVGFGPVDPARAVATEDQPWTGRGLVRGEVHDELSWFLGGQVGNAGLFGTAGDVLGFAEAFLDDRLFSAEERRLLTTSALAPRHRAPYGQALGPRLRDRDLVGGVDAIGHGGFTGTMWFALPGRGTAAVLLTNRVHPHRDLVDLGPFRRRFAAWVEAAP